MPVLGQGWRVWCLNSSLANQKVTAKVWRRDRLQDLEQWRSELFSLGWGGEEAEKVREGKEEGGKGKCRKEEGNGRGKTKK